MGFKGTVRALKEGLAAGIRAAGSLSLLLVLTLEGSEARIWNRAIPTIDEFSPNVVRITAERTNGSVDVGFGLLLFAKQNRIFVATADHILRGDRHDLVPRRIVVNLHESLGRRPMEVTSVSPFFDAKIDVACFEIWNFADDSFKETAKNWSSSLPLTRNDQYYYIGRNQAWYVPTRPSVYNSRSPNGSYVFDQIDVEQGSSGAPLYNDQNGLVAGLIKRKLGSGSAEAIPFNDVLRVLRNSSIQLEFESQSIALLYEDARASGQRFIQEMQRRQQSEPDSGDLFYHGPVVFDVNRDGILDRLQIWTSSGAGGGNHDEQYASVFLGQRSGTFKDKPDYQAQVGSRGGSKIMLDQLVRPDIETAGKENGFVLPGCQKAERDTMSQCSVEGDRLFIFCPSNNDQALVSVGFDEYEKDQYPRRDFRGLENLLGISLGNGKIRLTFGASTIPDSGIAPRQSYNAFEIAEVSQSGRRAGVQKGDFLVAVAGKTADTPRDLTCAIGDLDELPGRKFVIYRRTPQVQVLERSIPEKP
ncbi:trypsin-like peptidase domain-containing protein [Bradyrhizobium sp. CCBAU 51765]|uniref:trypsin-like peptidase domain-containing protein n=1 Tax=Bradyrhizobium sp. CCBAU 51765 TaxID=1325102 RepID=UPI0018881D64|nr:trypsin-like peptidase domain-containing protein [Bradyrhizobium sp. CCBAU 51765]